MTIGSHRVSIKSTRHLCTGKSGSAIKFKIIQGLISISSIILYFLLVQILCAFCCNVMTVPPNVKHAEEFLRLERGAEAGKRLVEFQSRDIQIYAVRPSILNVSQNHDKYKHQRNPIYSIFIRSQASATIRLFVIKL